MRVLQLIDSLEAGGAERVAVNLANALSKKVDKSFLCTTRKEGVLKESLNNDVEYLFLRKKRKVDLNAILKLKTFLKRNKIDIIHAHSSSFFIATIIKILYPRKTLIWHEHYGNREETSWLNKFVLKRSSSFFSSIIVVNQKLKIRSEKKLLCKNVYILANYPIVSLYSKITKMKGMPKKRIVCLANLRPDKDHENLIKAFLEVKQMHPDWSLHLVGKYYKDSYFEVINNLIKKLELKNHVFIYGSCNDVSNILEQSDIGVLSSKSEGLPMAMLEYGLSKLPVIATNVGDCNKIISNKNEGILVESNNSDALFNGLLEYIESKDLRDKVAKNLYNKIITSFSELNSIEKLITIYKQFKK